MADSIQFHSRVLTLMSNPSWREGVAIWEDELPKLLDHALDLKSLFGKRVILHVPSSIMPFITNLFKKAHTKEVNEWDVIVSKSIYEVKCNWEKLKVRYVDPNDSVRQALEILGTLQNLQVLKERAIAAKTTPEKKAIIIEILKFPQFEECFAQHKVNVLKDIAETFPTGSPIRVVLLTYSNEKELLAPFVEEDKTEEDDTVKKLTPNPMVLETVDTLNSLNPLMELKMEALAEVDDRKKFKIMIAILALPPNKKLFLQYKTGVIRAVAKTISEESPLRIELNEMMAKVFSLDLVENPQAGFERFTKIPFEVRAIFLVVVRHIIYSKKGNLTEFPQWPMHASSCEKLGLPNNKLTEIPAWIGNLSSLVQLDFTRNQIKKIPPELGELHSLKILALGGNNLREVPPELSQLSNLESLILVENQLETLPPEYCRLKNFPLMNGNPLVYLPSQLISKAPSVYKDFAFDVTRDLTLLKSLIKGDITFENLPVRLQVLINKSIYVFFREIYSDEIILSDPDFGEKTFRNDPKDTKVYYAISWTIQVLQRLKLVRDQAIEAVKDQDKLSLIIQMQSFPRDEILFNQQIAEAIIEVADTIPPSLRDAIDEKIGFEIFTLRPCSYAVRRAIQTGFST